MSKYRALEQFLRARAGDSIRLPFVEIERVLGFELPPSARRYAPWWANVGGSHVQAQAWLSAGWRTQDVDVPGEKVTFTRAAQRGGPRSDLAATGVEEASAPLLRGVLSLDADRLSAASAATLARYLNDATGDLAAALNLALEDAALTQRRRLIDRFAALSPKVGDDSVELLREARDGRG